MAPSSSKKPACLSTTSQPRERYPITFKDVEKGRILWLPPYRDALLTYRCRNPGMTMPVKLVAGFPEPDKGLYDHPIVVVSRHDDDANIFDFQYMTTFKKQTVTKRFRKMPQMIQYFYPIYPAPAHSGYEPLLLANGGGMPNGGYVAMDRVYSMDWRDAELYYGNDRRSQLVWCFDKNVMMEIQRWTTALTRYIPESRPNASDTMMGQYIPMHRPAGPPPEDQRPLPEATCTEHNASTSTISTTPTSMIDPVRPESPPLCLNLPQPHPPAAHSIQSSSTRPARMRHSDRLATEVPSLSFWEALGQPRRTSLLPPLYTQSSSTRPARTRHSDRFAIEVPSPNFCEALDPTPHTTLLPPSKQTPRPENPDGGLDACDCAPCRALGWLSRSVWWLLRRGGHVVGKAFVWCFLQFHQDRGSLVEQA